MVQGLSRGPRLCSLCPACLAGPSRPGRFVVVFNPLEQERLGVVSLLVDAPRVRVLTEDGQPLAMQLSAHWTSATDMMPNVYEVRPLCPLLPPGSPSFCRPRGLAPLEPGPGTHSPCSELPTRGPCPTAHALSMPFPSLCHRCLAPAAQGPPCLSHPGAEHPLPMVPPASSRLRACPGGSGLEGGPSSRPSHAGVGASPGASAGPGRAAAEPCL